MVWETLLYSTTLLSSLFLLLSARHSVSFKRWYDFPFLLGAGLFAWGIGHLFHVHTDRQFHLLSQPILLLFYICLLMAFHAFPRSPHLCFERWKSITDAAILTALYSSCSLPIWSDPSLAEKFLLLQHIQASLFLIAIAVVVWATTSQNSWREPRNMLLIGAMFFLLLDGTGHRLPGPIGFFLFVLPLLIIGIAQGKMQKFAEKVEVQDEYPCLHEKLQFRLHDENVANALILGAAVALASGQEQPLSYRLAMGTVLLLLFVRACRARREKRALMRELFHITSSLEKRLAENRLQIQAKNESLHRLLAFRQSYEKLLMVSNEQSLRETSYETLQRIIEELVDQWFSTMSGICFLQVSLHSSDGAAYYQVERGDPGENGCSEKHRFSVEIAIDENQETERMVRVRAVTDTEDFEEREWEKSFFRLLGVNVRGLILRCRHDQQSLELRLMEQEMELASKIQFSLIPRERLVLPQLEAKAVYIPVTYVGGDYVDFVNIDERYSGFLVADVSGHGIPASLLTTGIRHTFRAVVQTCSSPEQILERLNRILYEDLAKTRSFVTMFVAVYDREENVLRTSRAGHPPPLYLSASKRQILPCSGGVGLGLMKDAAYRLDEWKVEEDFTLLIYTDGLTELGRKAAKLDLSQWLRHFEQIILATGEEMTDRIRAIEQDIWQKTRQTQQDDDISVLIIDVAAGGKG
jgi:serine phosphatase RsbU (regulator of sigma subunit)